MKTYIVQFQVLVLVLIQAENRDAAAGQAGKLTADDVITMGEVTNVLDYDVADGGATQ